MITKKIETMEKDALVTSNRIKLEKEASRTLASLATQSMNAFCTCNTESFQWRLQCTEKKNPELHRLCHWRQIAIRFHVNRAMSLFGQCARMVKIYNLLATTKIKFFPEGYLNVIIKKFASLIHFFFLALIFGHSIHVSS